MAISSPHIGPLRLVSPTTKLITIQSPLCCSFIKTSAHLSPQLCVSFPQLQMPEKTTTRGSVRDVLAADVPPIFQKDVAQTEEYDAIVIGSGIGGLVTATQLAVRGARIILLEKYVVPGGSSSYFLRDGYTFDVGSCDVRVQ